MYNLLLIITGWGSYLQSLWINFCSVQFYLHPRFSRHSSAGRRHQFRFNVVLVVVEISWSTSYALSETIGVRLFTEISGAVRRRAWLMRSAGNETKDVLRAAIIRLGTLFLVGRRHFLLTGLHPSVVFPNNDLSFKLLFFVFTFPLIMFSNVKNPFCHRRAAAVRHMEKGSLFPEE